MEENYQKKLHGVMITRGWSQKKISEELGCSEAHVSRMLSGSHDPSKPLAKLIDLIVCEKQPCYGANNTLNLTPAEVDAITVMRECPEALSVVRMMGEMEKNDQRDIQARTEEKKLLADLKKELLDKQAA